MKANRAYLAWIIAWEPTALPSTQLPPPPYMIIKVVSNGRGPGLLAEVILEAINPLGWCIVEVSFFRLSHCLLLPLLVHLELLPLVMDYRKCLNEESLEVNGPPSLLPSFL